MLFRVAVHIPYRRDDIDTGDNRVIFLAEGHALFDPANQQLPFMAFLVKPTASTVRKFI